MIHEWKSFNNPLTLFVVLISMMRLNALYVYDVNHTISMLKHNIYVFLNAKVIR